GSGRWALQCTGSPPGRSGPAAAPGQARGAAAALDYSAQQPPRPGRAGAAVTGSYRPLPAVTGTWRAEPADPHTSVHPMLTVDMENKENGALDVKNSVENGRSPDPADWAVIDVVNYFRTAGFEEQANAFQEQVNPLGNMHLNICFKKLKEAVLSPYISVKRESCSVCLYQFPI
uniref:Sterile alpha motif domain containing 13 n=1 Tax=Nothoprocta perdicaria TaxID=30464 RepID=A0A8C6YPB6_NOTPE